MSRQFNQPVDLMRYFLVRYRGRTFVALSLLVLAGVAEGFGILSLLPVFEVAISNGAEPQSGLGKMVASALNRIGLPASLPVLLAITVVGITGKAVLTMASLNHVGYTGANVAADFRRALIEALMRARWQHFTEQRFGSIAASISAESSHATAAYLAVTMMFSAFVQSVVYIGLGAAVSWQGTIVALAAGLAAIFILRRFIHMTRTAGVKHAEVLRQLLNRLSDALTAFKSFKAMSREDRLRELLIQDTMNLRHAEKRKVLSGALIQSLQEPIFTIFLAVGVYVALTVLAFPFAEMMFVALVFYRAVSRIGQLQSSYHSLATQTGHVQNLWQSIGETRAAREQWSGTENILLEQEIRLENVSFAYGEQPTVADITLTIPARRLTALVGPSGSGKTTIVDLVTGLLQPQSGKILVDNVPLPNIDLKAWRSQIGYVPQDTILLHESIYNNLTLGQESLSRADAKAALQAADAWEFVSARPDGIDSIVGERGAKLSGGQRQRVAIARALIHRPNLLILDEPTSGLDGESADAVIETLTRVSREVTVLAISHQHNIVAAADVVYRVEQGRVQADEKSGGAAKSAIS